ncbi:unnamed protein product [Lampetra fluviatilis]
MEESLLIRHCRLGLFGPRGSSVSRRCGSTSPCPTPYGHGFYRRLEVASGLGASGVEPFSWGEDVAYVYNSPRVAGAQTHATPYHAPAKKRASGVSRWMDLAFLKSNDGSQSHSRKALPDGLGHGPQGSELVELFLSLYPVSLGPRRGAVSCQNHWDLGSMKIKNLGKDRHHSPGAQRRVDQHLCRPLGGIANAGRSVRGRLRRREGAACPLMWRGPTGRRNRCWGGHAGPEPARPKKAEPLAVCLGARKIPAGARGPGAAAGSERTRSRSVSAAELTAAQPCGSLARSLAPPLSGRRTTRARARRTPPRGVLAYSSSPG